MSPDRLRLALLILAGIVIAFNVYMYLTWPDTPPDTSIEAPAGTTAAP